MVLVEEEWKAVFWHFDYYWFGNCYCLVLFSPVLMESTNYSAARLCCHSTYSIFFMPEKLGEGRREEGMEEGGALTSMLL